MRIFADCQNYIIFSKMIPFVLLTDSTVLVLNG